MLFPEPSQPPTALHALLSVTMLAQQKQVALRKLEPLTPFWALWTTLFLI